ncbi:MAG: serine/threonine protein kinase [Deltaproteobacteria bacterium SG8_13]|nr:MAG: serine/threonine protein kinase [Deltaproteobacteria bacterium SG8_13]
MANPLKKHPVIIMGLGVTLLFLLLGLVRLDFIDTLDLKVYDLLMNLRSNPQPSSEIVIVDIDDDAIEKLGRWPWPRSLLADGLRKIEAGGPKVIGLNIILSEPQTAEGLQELQRLEAQFTEQILPLAGDRGQSFRSSLAQIRRSLDHDRRLAEALQQSGKVVLPVFLKQTAVAAERRDKVDASLLKQSVQNIQSPVGAVYPRAGEIALPIAEFSRRALGIGHINLSYDSDGTARKEWPLYAYSGVFVPSYTLRIAAAYLNVPINKVRAVLGSAIYVGGLQIPLTLRNEIMVSFKGSGGSFKKYAFFDILNDKIPGRVFANKIVLVSPSAAGIMNPLSTPTDATMTVGEFSAHAIWSILNQNVIQQPVWSTPAELLLILITGLVITFLISRLKALTAGIVFVALLAMLVGSSAFLFVSRGLWVGVSYPLLLLVIGYIGIISLQYFVTETRKDIVEGESAETNRMLGLSFQSQGMLDMAFDKLRRVPVNDQMKDILYNLALDFERKRQLNKAAMVYAYIEEHDPGFKDAADKKHRLMQVSETMVYGDGFLGGSSETDDLTAAGTGTRPTLGRYEVLKPLGKGAMGVVYMGQDPRINRTTAIKTFRFGDDMEPDAIAELKTKFFREAESAGTLSHPNIVTIYDAGDEQDLAYIAMEYLEGENLDPYTRKNHLLPMLKVIDYTADIADGLEYAHQKGIVHRDIKPANIMLLKSGEIKITDFGIARITATSQTQTGIVKGTPYYMSPEQISGVKVDGRSDIFSLGVMLFQLLTGALPFHGENPAALMHQIMQVRHPDPRTINPKIITPLVKVVDRALEKDRENRYQHAAQLRDQLREIRRMVNAVIAKRQSQPPGN